METVLSLAVGLLPVFVLLLFLILLDSFKLLKLRSVLAMLALGASIAMISLYVNQAALDVLAIDRTNLTRYVAPLIEECLKAAVIVFLLYRNRIGFPVDAAIRGFAIGAGFAAAENIHYFLTLADSRLVLWILRGLGTAIMHGGVTALMAVIAKHLSDLHGKPSPRTWLPGILLAVALHSFFNHFFLSPSQSTVILLVILPIVFIAVFRASERSTRRWMGIGFDTDSELLEAINSGRASTTRIGSYLTSLRRHFSPGNARRHDLLDPHPTRVVGPRQGKAAGAGSGVRRRAGRGRESPAEGAATPREVDRQNRQGGSQADLQHVESGPLAGLLPRRAVAPRSQRRRLLAETDGTPSEDLQAHHDLVGRGSAALPGNRIAEREVGRKVREQDHLEVDLRTEGRERP